MSPARPHVSWALAPGVRRLSSQQDPPPPLDLDSSFVDPLFKSPFRNRPMERFLFDAGKQELKTSTEFDLFLHSLLDRDKEVSGQSFTHGLTPEAVMGRFKDPIEKFTVAMESVRWMQEDLKMDEEDLWAEHMLPDEPEKPMNKTQQEMREEIRALTGNFTLPQDRDPDFEYKVPPNVPEKMPEEALRNCYFCNTLKKDKYLNGKRGIEKYHLWNAMNVPLLTRYISGNGAILPKRVTGNCPRHQRKIAKVIKKAIHMGFFSWKRSNFRIRSPFPLPKNLVDHEGPDFWSGEGGNLLEEGEEDTREDELL